MLGVRFNEEQEICRDCGIIVNGFFSLRSLWQGGYSKGALKQSDKDSISWMSMLHTAAPPSGDIEND